MGKIVERYKLEIVEEQDSELLIYTDLSFEEMSKHFKEHINSYSFKIFKSINEGEWKVEVFYKEGKVTQYRDLFKDLTKISESSKKHLESLLMNMFQLL